MTEGFERHFLRSLLTLLAAGCASPSKPVPPIEPATDPHPTADLVLSGGLVHTLVAERPTASALAVVGRNIVAVGDEQTVREWIGPNTRHIRLSGRTVVPGLADGHVDLLRTGERRAQANLTGARSLQAALDRIRETAANVFEPGEWVRGRGWENDDWSDQSGPPTAADLDRVVPNKPVCVVHANGQAVWLNSLALDRAGITEETPNPRGGRIEKKGGKPTGILRGAAVDLVDRVRPAPSPQAIENAIQLAQRHALDVGLTQVHAFSVGPLQLEALRRLDASGRLRIRVYAFVDGSIEDLTELMDTGPKTEDEARRLTVRGLSFAYDGDLRTRSALLLARYRRVRSVGRPQLPIDLLEARVRTAKDQGFQVAIRAAGDRAVREVLDLYERVYGTTSASTGAGKHRPRLEGADLVHPDDSSRFRSLGVSVTTTPARVFRARDWVERRIGRRRALSSYAWSTMAAAGTTLLAGSDAPDEELSPLMGLYALITRKDLLGFPTNGWFPSERLSPPQALRAYTTAAAYASFRDERAGQIAVGRIADLTVLNKDPLSATEDDLASMQAALTIVGGRVEVETPGVGAPRAHGVGAAKTSTVAP